MYLFLWPQTRLVASWNVINDTCRNEHGWKLSHGLLKNIQRCCCVYKWLYTVLNFSLAAFLYCNSTTVHSTFRYDSPRFLYKERGRLTDKRSHRWADVSDMNLNLATDSKPWTPAAKGFTQYTTMAEQLLYSDPPVKDFTAEKVRVHRCTEDDIRLRRRGRLCSLPGSCSSHCVEQYADFLQSFAAKVQLNGSCRKKKCNKFWKKPGAL